MKNNYPCVVSFAGTDPSGGAGIQADIKAISATGSYAATVITALVAQNTQGVQAIYAVPVEFVEQQIESVFSDLSVSTIKIGMLHTKKIIEMVATAIEKYKFKHIVLDPVMVAKNGCALLETETIDVVKNRLCPLVTLITPNLNEAEIMLDEKIKTLKEMEVAATKMGRLFNTNILLKGGHLNLKEAADVLYVHKENACYWYVAERIDTLNTHGTGCSLAAAIASYVAQGQSLLAAVAAGKKYITGAIESGKTMQIGKGFGPVDHFFMQKSV